MTKLFSAKGAAYVCALAAITVTAAAPAAQSVTFAGKRIEIIVLAAGGGSDVYTRALPPFLEKHLPGKPTIIVRNVPGARCIPGANQFQQRAKPDGTHAVVVSTTTVASYVFERAKVKFELDKWEPVLLSPQGAIAYAAPSLGVKSAKDLPKLKGQPLVFGGQSATSGELRFT